MPAPDKEILGSGAPGPDADPDGERRERRARTQGAPGRDARSTGPRDKVPGPDTKRRAWTQGAPGTDARSAGPRHKVPGPDTKRRGPRERRDSTQRDRQRVPGLDPKSAELRNRNRPGPTQSPDTDPYRERRGQKERRAPTQKERREPTHRTPLPAPDPDTKTAGPPGRRLREGRAPSQRAPGRDRESAGAQKGERWGPRRTTREWRDTTQQGLHRRARRREHRAPTQKARRAPTQRAPGPDRESAGIRHRGQLQRQGPTGRALGPDTACNRRFIRNHHSALLSPPILAPISADLVQRNVLEVADFYGELYLT